MDQEFMKVLALMLADAMQEEAPAAWEDFQRFSKEVDAVMAELDIEEDAALQLVAAIHQPTPEALEEMKRFGR